MKVSNKSYNRDIKIIILFLLLSENGMYLINIEKLNISGAFNYNDMWAYGLLLYELYYIAKIKMPKRYTFKFEIWGMLACCIVASVQASYIFLQPVMMGIRPQRFFIICLLTYFLVRKLLAVKKITVFHLLDGMITMGIIEGALCAAQYFLSGHVKFLYVDTGVRYGSVRMYIDSGLIMFTTIAGWCFFLKRGKPRYILAVVVGFIYEFLISKGRLENMCILASLAVAFVLLRKNTFKKVMVLLSLVSIVVLLLNTSYSKVMIDTVKSIFSESSEVSETGDTMLIRKQGRQHYLEQSNEATSNLIFGCGYPNTIWEKACEYACTEKYKLVDNGIFSYKYIYGLLGLSFVGILTLKVLFESMYVYIKKGAIFPISYIVFLAPLAYNVIFWWWKPDSTLLLSIYLAIVDYYCHDEYRDDEFII